MTKEDEMQETINWDTLSRLGKLRAVIDPHDGMGFKNMLIDRVHWLALRPQLRRSHSVLDFGCGTGRFAKRIKRMGLRYTGIDSSNGMIRAARDWNRSGGAKFQHFDGVHIPYPDASCDTVIISRVLIHILKTTEWETIFSEIRRVLVPGGHLILLEEASLSGRKSGQARWPLTEEDFVNAISKYFDIKVRHKVRSSEFSMFSRRITEIPGHMPYFIFRGILAPLARFELFRVLKHDNSYYAKVTYYDFLIHATLRK